MLVVGLTGGIAAGKTTVSRLFEDLGVPVICADELAREAVEPGAPALADIRRVFGPTVIDDAGGLDRVGMAKVVFQDPAKRKILEEIVHPRVAEAKEKRLGELQRAGHRIVMVDVPLLYESGWDHLFDLVIVVYAPAQVQLERLMQRDHMPLEEARSRLDAQMPIEDKRKLADRVVDNSGTPEQTRAQVQRTWEELERLARSKEAGIDPHD
ncbi:MAG: dephospho-CoA kinase [Desulfomonile tiedjei]|nr:dephospho-CoA kinase [Desulfomonile tiedjei]